MTKYTTQQGFHIVEAGIAIVVLALVGLGGYVAWHRSHAPATDVSSRVAAPNTADTTATPVVPTVSTVTDLDTAARSVDELDADTTQADLTSLENELNSLQ